MGEYPNKSKKSASMTGKKKVESTASTGKNGFAAGGKGANHKMFGKQHAGPKAAGVTGDVEKSKGGKFAAGGNTKMFGKQHAGTQLNGETSGTKYSSKDKTEPMKSKSPKDRG